MPLWVFHRPQAVARALLREHGIDDSGMNMGSAEARQELEAGRHDAAFFVTSYRDPSVTALLRRPDITLLRFRREAAYSRKLPGLHTVKLPEGVLDLRDNIARRHRDLSHWRLHVTMVRNETLARLAQMEKEAPASVPLTRRSASGHRD